MSVPQSHIAHMGAYPIPAITDDAHIAVSLAQNESLRGPGQHVEEAIAASLAGCARYPDPDCTALRNALADLHAIDPDRILCGGGSLDLINCLARVFAGPDRSVLVSAHGYPFFRTAAQMANARIDVAPEVSLTLDIDGLLDAVRPTTGLVLIANPGNPTGTHVARSALSRLRENLRDDILLVIDEAYGEYTDHLGGQCFDMCASGNTAVLRTFSKAYGMAGLRIGWGLFPSHVADQLRKVLNPNAVSAIAQAGAIAALSNQAYLRRTCALTREVRDRVGQRLAKGGLSVVPSAANFVLIDFGTRDAAGSAQARLCADGYVLRPQAGAGLPHALRMTMATQDVTLKAAERLVAWKMENDR